MADYGVAANHGLDFDDDPRGKPGVASALESLQSECDRFNKIAAVFEERLAAVLNPSTPYASGELKEDRAEPSSPLAGDIERRIDQLRQAGATLDRIIQRIDV